MLPSILTRQEVDMYALAIVRYQRLLEEVEGVRGRTAITCFS